MQKLGIIISFFIIFLNSTSLNQLFKVPFLFIHYQEHHQIDRQVSFYDFLSMHYWGTDLNDNDQDKDMQLPFKKASESSFFQIFLPASRTSVEYQKFYVGLQFQQVIRRLHLTHPALSSLFRPPRA